MQKYIIGGGISGLIYAFYNRDFTVISSDVGGKLRNNYLSSTILLHDAPETRRLLTDLKMELQPVPHLIKYHNNHKLHESIPANLKEIMAAKKMTPWQELDNLNLAIKPTDTTLSVNDIYIPVFRISTHKLVQELAKYTTIIKDDVLRITPNEIVTNKARYEYDELISTIPAPTFWRLYGAPRSLAHLPETFVLSTTCPVKEDAQKLHWDLIYFLDKDVPYTRVNRYKKGQYLYEITGKMTAQDIRRMMPDVEVVHHYTDPHGLILTDLNNIPPPKVRFVGRFAVWNHSYKLQDVIKDSIARYDFISVWNKQKEFNVHFFDHNVKDIEELQRVSKDYILHVLDEVHEMLRETNWKMGQYTTRAVDRNKLREEWIDIFKYWLGLGNVWGFTIEEMFDEFWRKSAIVDKRYEKYLSNKTEHKE